MTFGTPFEHSLGVTAILYVRSTGRVDRAARDRVKRLFAATPSASPANRRSAAPAVGLKGSTPHLGSLKFLAAGNERGRRLSVRSRGRRPRRSGDGGWQRPQPGSQRCRRSV